MIGENFDSSTEDSKSFASIDCGYGSMLSCDQSNNWMILAEEEALDFLERMLSWLDSMQ